VSYWRYEGAVHVNALGRGVVLDTDKKPMERFYLEDAIEGLVPCDPATGWTGRMRVTVEVLEVDDS
jgi:hypothetical protein